MRARSCASTAWRSSRKRSGPVWWVLDYKLSHAPEELDAHRAQLLRYRAAVARAQPGEEVRCAFVTGAGRVVEVV